MNRVENSESVEKQTHTLDLMPLHFHTLTEVFQVGFTKFKLVVNCLFQLDECHLFMGRFDHLNNRRLMWPVPLLL